MNIRKSFFIALCAAAAAVMLAPITATAQSSLEQIKTRGKLLAGVKFDTPPFGFLDKDNKPVGFDLDLATKVAEKIGVPVEFVKVTSPTRIPLLVSGNVDLVAASMTHTIERDKTIDFSITYYTGGQALLVKNGSDIKGVAEQLAVAMEIPLRVTADGPSFLLDGQKAELFSGERAIGWIGQLDPTVLEARDLPGDDAVFGIEIDLDAMSASGSDAPKFAVTLPRYPSVVRDLAILVDDILSAGTVRDTIRAASPPTLVDVHEFDRYQGKGIPDGKVSLALRLTFQSTTRTLTDTEVNAAMEGIVASLSKQLGAIQR